MVDRTGNLPPLPGIFPDYTAPIVRNYPQGRELVLARWGMPSPAFVEGAQVRSGRDQRPQRGLTALAALARDREPCGGALHQLRRDRGEAGREPGADLVRPGRQPPARLLRRHLGPLDVGSQGEGGRGDERLVRVPDDRAERRGGRLPPEGHAGDPDHTGRDRQLADRAGLGSAQAERAGCPGGVSVGSRRHRSFRPAARAKPSRLGAGAHSGATGGQQSP